MAMVTFVLNIDEMVKYNLLISKWMDSILGTYWWSYPKNSRGC